jgi:hypothetical protein
LCPICITTHGLRTILKRLQCLFSTIFVLEDEVELPATHQVYTALYTHTRFCFSFVNRHLQRFCIASALSRILIVWLRSARIQISCISRRTKLPMGVRGNRTPTRGTLGRLTALALCAGGENPSKKPSIIERIDSVVTRHYLSK